MQVDLSGRTALVTGASSGFGRRFAMTLAMQGAQVIAAARRMDALQCLVTEIRDAGGVARAVALDVTDALAVEQMIGGLPSLDIVVNNAGIGGGGRALDCEEAEWRLTYDVNVHGVWFVARQAALRMNTLGRGGSIINIASITGIRPGVSVAGYSSSKAAVIQLTKALAMEWARHGIRVNAIAPGYFETDLTRELLQSDFGQSMLKRVPQRRYGELSELDGPLLLLASDASSYMTGSIIAVDGGHLVSVL
ncbi:MAG: SDR family oxidoreductase [Caulobacteraceae bacterium]